jgi:hypothetical protein
MCFGFEYAFGRTYTASDPHNCYRIQYITFENNYSSFFTEKNEKKKIHSASFRFVPDALSDPLCDDGSDNVTLMADLHHDRPVRIRPRLAREQRDHIHEQGHAHRCTDAGGCTLHISLRTST